MKKKYLNLLIIFVLTLVIGTEKANAYSVSRELQSNFWNDYGIPNLYYKTIDGTEAFCSYFRKDAPASGGNGNLSLGSDEYLSETDKIGIAAIINSSASEVGVNDTYALYAAKELAINLYLSSNHGMDRLKPTGRDVYLSWRVNGSSLRFDNVPGIVSFLENGNAVQEAIVQLYNKAKSASSNTSSNDAYLAFSGNSDTKFNYSNGTFSATFYVESNVDISSINASVSGVSDTSKVRISISDNKISISFPDSIVNSTYATVYVSATATYPTATVLKFVDGAQPLVLVENQNDKKSVNASRTVFVANSCLKYLSTCDPLSCNNTDNQNKTECKTYTQQYYSSSPCDDSIRQSGKKTISLIDGVCSLYCTEQATVSYPGNVGSAILLGTNLEWPTNLNGKYPLTTKSTLSCTVEMDNKSSVTQECLNAAARKNYSYINDLYHNGKIVYSKPEKTGSSLSTSTASVNLSQSCNYSINVNGASVSLDNRCSYNLPKDKNIAINKKTYTFINILKDSASNAVTNAIIMKNGGVLPIDGFSWTDKSIFSNTLFNSKYDLQINDMPLGYEGQMTNSLNKNTYVCNYKITTDLSGSCTCPPGTKNSGKNLSDVLEKNPTTCAEAQNIYCDESLPYCPDDSETPGKDISNCMLTHDYDYCVEKNCHSEPDPHIYCKMPDGSYTDITDCWNENGQDENAYKVCSANVGCINNYCPSNSALGDSYNYREDPDYASCLSGGGTADYCMNLVCNPECIGNNCDYTCKSYTELTGIQTDYPEKIISACVSYERGSGKNLVEAITACGKKECFKGAEGKIIYRTISLENPFPSKDADSTVTQNLRIGMFNDTIKGRYPGANWNGEQLVKNKILNNRGYDGSAIYNEATPLYTINLDAKAIKAIRSYNKRQVDGYADFTLKCTDGAYCISSFLRSGITRADGTNMLDSGSSTCAGASNKITFNSCYKKR